MDGNISSVDRERSLYLTHISYLEDELDRCQLRYDELEKQNDRLSSQQGALEKEKKDATEYLKCLATAEEERVAELKEQLQVQDQAAQRDREALELQHSQRRQELQELLQELETGFRMQESTEKEQQETVQLKQRLSHMKSLQEQLILQREEHEAAVVNLRKDRETDKENISEELQVNAEAHVEKETSRILRRERAELSRWSRDLLILQEDFVILGGERDAARDSGSILRTEWEEVKKLNQEIPRRGSSQIKEVKQQKDTYLHLKEELKDCNTFINLLLKEMEDMRDRLLAMREQNRQITSELDQLEAELERRRRRKSQLEGVRQEAAVILGHILEIKTQTQDPERRADTHWMMERLLEILESSAPQETDSAPLHSSSRPQAADPKPERDLSDEKTSSCGNLSTPQQADPAPDPDPDPEASSSADC
ncbi:cilia- and flagella-associated protein 157-like [Notolabrus celidotus]|uniref:cilia- and flagella-associated protein 157-like n=1 Tax=Notolabrus celidotus TaxID=1203425 RepID=UPI0014902C9F|nr:cilia- and flagella-associated protein 157-like [Notolabrus celidotus]